VSAADGVLATHPLITAVPFFVPTFVVVAVIAVVVWRDRRRTGGEYGGEHVEHVEHGDGGGEGGAPPGP
jgi:hypothetical protein